MERPTEKKRARANGTRGGHASGHATPRETQRQFGFLWPVKGRLLGTRNGTRQRLWHLGERDLVEHATLNFHPEAHVQVKIEVKPRDSSFANAHGSLQRRWGRGIEELPPEVRRIVRGQEVVEAAWHVEPEMREEDEERRRRGKQTLVLGRGIAGGIVAPSLMETAQELANHRKKPVWVLASIWQGNEYSEAIAKRQGFKCRHHELKEYDQDSRYIGYWLKKVSPH